ncbi:YidC/Oxa1 family membrane protein insertase [Schnuerera sp. xch1]|uniref:YidC/Oxa1 family membrane protein insertase n=1 Tax=Schnuerera sp. xch1 TaxID=2874283 RepID=UPI001CBEA2EB|nr:YidC/Oxa1 family membrane protein insertase [Schnuerera sp. xch1]MBZ2175696.1 YidC/Oxa1 family membrane protein insertase [Schnuerera sp. xch1]
MTFLGNLLGSLMKFVFDVVSQVGTETKLVSYYGITIIITTIIFKLILLPISLHQSKSTKKMNELQPKMKEIQEKYKNDPQTQQTKMMQLYKENNYNPMSGCLPLLIQFPIIIAIFKVLRDPVQFVFKDPAIYDTISKGFLWIPNLEQPDPYLWGLPLLAGLTTFLQSKLMTGNVQTNSQAQSTQKIMNIFLPVMIFMASRSFASGLALYWVIGNIFQIVQQLIINRSLGEVKEETK